MKKADEIRQIMFASERAFEKELDQIESEIIEAAGRAEKSITRTIHNELFRLKVAKSLKADGFIVELTPNYGTFVIFWGNEEPAVSQTY